jgi:putative transposase
MQEEGIVAIYPKPNTSKANLEHKVYPYLLNGLNITSTNQVWMVDITYLKLNSKHIYLVALIDVFSRYITGWNLSLALDTENCLTALEVALKKNIPEIINSDQGCQFTSHSW